jgi:uncharacterized membrane protein
MPMQATTTTPLFAATLKPDRSLRSGGGWLALVIVGLVGGPFLIAAPELVVPGLAAYAIAGAALLAFTMRMARRHRVVEQVTVWPDQVEICRISPGQDRLLKRYAPQNLRLRLVRDANERTTSIHLCHGSDSLEIGAFLAQEDKSSFAKSLGAALRAARRGA